MIHYFSNGSNKLRRAIALATVVGAGSLTAPSLVLAQDDEEFDLSMLEEIVVTARYREESLQVSPLAISAISADELQNRNFTSSADVALTIPNASFRPAQAAFGNTLTAFIRGIGQNDFNFAFEPGVGVYIDDVYHATTMGSMMDLMDLERVEVLRGPQGTLFGRGSIGGAIRMVSKKPAGDGSGNIQFTTGSFDRVELRGSYDFAITDTLYARVTGMSKSREGYQDVLDFACAHPNLAGSLPVVTPNRRNSCKIGTQGGEDVVGFRGALLWSATPDLEVMLTYDMQDDDSEVRANTLLNANVIFPFTGYSDLVESIYGVPFDSRFIPQDPYITYATFTDLLTGLRYDPKTSIETEGMSAKVDYTYAENHGVTVILSQRNFDSYFAVDNDGSPLNIQMTDGIQQFESSTAEIRFNGLLLDNSLEYTVGAFTYDGEVSSAQAVSLPGLLVGFGAPYPDLHDGILVNGLVNDETEHDSVFGHFVYDASEQLSFSLGARWSDDSKKSDFDNTIVQADLSSSDDRVDWKVGVDYRLNDDVMVYASAASGYRPQAYNPRPFQVTQFVPVDGEEAVSYDMGIKGDFFDNTLRVNAAVFYVDYKQRITPQGGVECPADADGNYTNLVPVGTDGAITDSTGNICLGPTISRTFYTNTPGEIRGIEIETVWSPIDNLVISGAYGYTDWESPDITDNPDVVSDNPAFVPSFNWSLTASYVFNLNSGARLTPRIDFYGQDDICSGTASLDSCSAGFELMNARLQWDSADSGWSAALGMTNVGDEFYYYNKFDLTAFGQPTTEGQPGRPEEWYLTVRREF